MGRSSVAAGGTVYYGASLDSNSEADRLAGMQELMNGFAGRITSADRLDQTHGSTYRSLYFKYSWMDVNKCFAANTYREDRGYQFTIYVSGTGDVYAYFRESGTPSEIISSPEWRGYCNTAAVSTEPKGMDVDYNGGRRLAIANVALHPIGSNAEATRAMVQVGTQRPVVWSRDITAGTTMVGTPLSTPSSSQSSNAGKIIVLGPIFAAKTGGVSANARMVVMSDNTLGPGSYQIGGIPYQFVGVDSGNDSGTQAALALRGSTSTVSTD